MNLNEPNIEQKRIEFINFKRILQMLLTDGCRLKTSTVPAYIVDEVIEKLQNSDKKDAILEYSIKSGNKVGKTILVGMGRKILMLKSNGEDYEYSAIPRNLLMLDMPEKNIAITDIQSPYEEYSLSQFFKDTNKAAAPGVLPIMFAQAKRPMVICNDGFELSIQASNGHYCEPCENNRVDYISVELGNVSEETPELSDYEEVGNEDELRKRVYGFVPRTIVEEILRKHGGINKEKTLTETYLTEIKRVEDGLRAANREMQDMKNIASILGKVLGGNDDFWR